MRVHLLALDVSDLAAIHLIAERLEPLVRDQFIAAVNRLRDLVDLPALARAIAQDNARAAEALLHLDDFPDELQPLIGTLRQVFHGAGALATEEVAGVLNVSIAFDVVNPRAVRWAAEQGATLIHQVTAATRAGVRTLIADGLENGRAPLATARQIRDLIGLTDRQASAVNRYAQTLEGRSAEEIDRLVARYGHRLLTQRAQLIARTETITASAQGQLEAWRQAAGQGLIDSRRTKRRWSATGDDRTCLICLDLDGDEVAFGEPFHSTFEGSLMTPPVHPGCRCAVGLVFES